MNSNCVAVAVSVLQDQQNNNNKIKRQVISLTKFVVCNENSFYSRDCPEEDVRPPRKSRRPSLGASQIWLHQVVEDEFMWSHQVGAVVWAKVAGHTDPFWPGVVKAIKTVFQVSKNQEQYRNLYRYVDLPYQPIHIYVT